MSRRTSTDDLKDLIRDMGKMPKEVRQEIRPALRASAKKPLQQARANASWSTRIPGATGIRVNFSKRTAGVSLVVNKNKAPHARAYENEGKQGWFRTPLFGNRELWFRHRARPFFYQVGPPWVKEVDQAVGQAVDKVSRRNKFR